MNQPLMFNHHLFGTLEIILVDGIEYFPATDVAITLGYSNPQKAIRDHCKIAGCTNRSVSYPSGSKNKRFINEGNLYRLIVKSQLPEADKFEAWVFEEVLPTIRKTGGYVQENRAIDFVNSWLPQLDEHSKHAVASTLEQNKKLMTENQKLTTTIQDQRPKVVFAEAYEVSDDLITVKEMANLLKQKGLDIGEKRLYKWLRENGYVCKKIGDLYNLPTQRSLDLGILEIKKGIRTGTGGALRQTRTTKVTGKGQIYFVNKLLPERAVI